MDKKIKQIQKGTEKLAKQESQLLKEDKKRDKVCTMGKEMMDRKKKQIGLLTIRAFSAVVVTPFYLSGSKGSIPLKLV